MLARTAAFAGLCFCASVVPSCKAPGQHAAMTPGASTNEPHILQHPSAAELESLLGCAVQTCGTAAAPFIGATYVRTGAEPLHLALPDGYAGLRVCVRGVLGKIEESEWPEGVAHYTGTIYVLEPGFSIGADNEQGSTAYLDAEQMSLGRAGLANQHVIVEGVAQSINGCPIVRVGYYTWWPIEIGGWPPHVEGCRIDVHGVGKECVSEKCSYSDIVKEYPSGTGRGQEAWGLSECTLHILE
jgi:hypothetical protein